MLNNYIEYMNDLIKYHSHKTAFEFLTDDFVLKRVSFQELYDDVCKGVWYFVKRGIFEEKIGIQVPNSYEWFVYYYAIVASGNIAVLYPNDMSSEDREKMIQFTETKYMFCMEESYNTLSFCGMVEKLELDFTAEGPAVLPPLRVGREKLACILFTSGTTGSLKAVCLSNKNCLCAVNHLMMTEIMGKKEQRMLYTLPFSHIGAVTVATAFYSGTVMVILKSPKYFLKTLEITNPDLLVATPNFLDLLLKKEKILKYEKCKLKGITCAGALIDKEKIEYFGGLGINVIHIYGMTETTGMGVTNFYIMGVKEYVADVVEAGKVEDGITVEIIDGEIVMSGDSIMMGYFKNPEETALFLKDGKLYSGDLGYFDEHGALRITGRRKNLIILSNGENISPEGIETEIRKCMEVEACMVYGNKEKLCVDVQLKRDTMDSREKVKGWILLYNERQPFYKKIVSIYFVDKISRSRTGKILRNKG